MVLNIQKNLPSNVSKIELIEELLTFFSDTPKIKSIFGSILLSDSQTTGKLDEVKLVELIGYLHQKSKEDEKISNTDKRKHFGIYYTPYSIARQLASELISRIQKKDLVNNKTFFEPCAGVGIFIIAFLDEIIENKKINDQTRIQKIVNNIYYADIDGKAIEILKKILPIYIKKKHGINIKLKDKNSYKGNVLFSIKNSDIKKFDPISYFKLKNNFDFVLTNPPYRLLKANSNKYKQDGTHNHHNEIKDILNFIRKNNVYKYNEGTLNYYKIFIEEILENYTNDKARVGLLIPITLLNDKQSSLLRKRILDNYNIKRLYTIPENNIFFQDISQAFCFFVLEKSKKTDNFKIITNINSKKDFNNTGYSIDIETIKNTSGTYSITITDNNGMKILKKLSTKPKLGKLGLLNLRGELDLTLHKNYITDEKTELPLIKGIDVDSYSIKGYGSFVKENFLEKINAKSSHVKTSRIVGQQISNMNSKKRLKFALIDNNFILGNSCNYLMLSQNLFGDYNLTLKYLLGILNSRIIDWRFRITNSNNHVSNYELSELPIAIVKNDSKKKMIEEMVDKIIETKDKTLEDKLNNIIFDLYEINESERAYINKYYE
jgi:Alw26I/Eco31I/Esp3I family type II restriction m6 adenine DNA methyltransferase